MSWALLPFERDAERDDPCICDGYGMHPYWDSRNEPPECGEVDCPVHSRDAFDELADLAYERAGDR